jgi:hypothetical protein
MQSEGEGRRGGGEEVEGWRRGVEKKEVETCWFRCGEGGEGRLGGFGT